MLTNIQVLNLLTNNFLLILLLVLFTAIRIIPPEWAGFWKYNNNKEADGRAPKISILRFLLHCFVESIFTGVLIPLLTGFGFKNIITLIIFIVVIFDVFIRHQISGEAVGLIGIGIIALYLEKLIETGKSIKLFGGLLSWDKDDRIFDQNNPIDQARKLLK